MSVVQQQQKAAYVAETAVCSWGTTAYFLSAVSLSCRQRPSGTIDECRVKISGACGGWTPRETMDPLETLFKKAGDRVSTPHPALDPACAHTIKKQHPLTLNVFNCVIFVCVRACVRACVFCVLCVIVSRSIVYCLSDLFRCKTVICYQRLPPPCWRYAMS